MDTMPSIVFESKGVTYSIPSTNVRSIIKLPEITPIPNSDPFVRGIIEHRKNLYTVVDFRILTSEKSLVEEFSIFRNMLEQREKDHVNWLIELENSVIENRPFTLATDPHKCAFGKWYDNYKSKNLGISKILYKFNKPHKKIHMIATEIENLKEKGLIEECKSIIESTRNVELNTMKSLFTKLKDDSIINFTESAILLDMESKKIALAIEKVSSVESIKKQDTQNLNNFELVNFDNSLITGLGESKESEMIVMLSDKLLLN